MVIGSYKYRDYAEDKHKTVDDTPFGGGSGMVMRADVIANSLDKNISKKRANYLFITKRKKNLIKITQRK